MVVPVDTTVPDVAVKLMFADTEPIVLLVREKPLPAEIVMLVLATKISPLAKVTRPLHV